MPSLELTAEEWQTLTMILTKQPWDVANPLLFKMAQRAKEETEWRGLPINPPVMQPGMPYNEAAAAKGRKAS